MLSTLLQTVTDFGVFNVLTQYGVLGITTLGLAAAVWYLLKRQLSSEERLKDKVDTLQREMNDYIREDQHKLMNIIENNTEAMRELRDIILSKNRR
jgi:biopolymer transport protein ExbB/TolQ